MREGMVISVSTLIKLLEQVPDGKEPIVISRRDATISVSIPDGPLPWGWEAVNEAGFQQTKGYRRVKFTVMGRSEWIEALEAGYDGVADADAVVQMLEKDSK